MLGHFSISEDSISSQGGEVNIVQESVSESATASESLSTTVGTLVTDSASTSETVAEKLQGSFEEVATASETLTESGTRSDSVEDAAATGDALHSSVADSETASAAASEAISETIIALTEESAATSESVSEPLTATDSLEETVAASEQISESIVGVFAESAAASESIIETRGLTDSLSESATTSDALTQVLTGTADAFEESAEAGETISQSLEALQKVEDEAVALETVYDSEGLSAWSAHVELFAMSQFKGLEAESVTAIGDTPYLAGADGFYKLDGNDDDGTLISSEVRPFPSDFGDPRLKHMRYLYVGYQGGRMEIGVTNHEIGKAKEYNYKVDKRKDDVSVPGRAKLGRGAKSRYFDVRLLNVNGSRFSLHDAKLVVDETTRQY